MNLLNYYAIVEDTFLVLGINPEEARCAGEGEWMLQKGDTEIYIDVWVPEGVNQWQYYLAENPEPVLQITVPMAVVPETADFKALSLDILALNAQMYYGSFIFNPQDRMLALQYKRLATGINQREVLEPLNALGYYSENLLGLLTEKFKLIKL